MTAIQLSTSRDIRTLYELNGFPSWFQSLIHTHPDTVRSVLLAQIQAEWVCAAEHHSILRFASTEPPDTAALLRDVAIADGRAQKTEFTLDRTGFGSGVLPRVIG